MKVLLVAVNAKYIHSNLAVYDLKAYTENIPVEVELAEYTINQQQEEILRDIYEHKADVVAFSCYIWNITYVKALAEELHKIAPQVQIWFGGPEASYDAKQLLRELSYVELVIVGEGEETFAQLLQKHLLDGERLENIVGICYRENTGEICDNGIREVTRPWARSSGCPSRHRPPTDRSGNLTGDDDKIINMAISGEKSKCGKILKGE